MKTLVTVDHDILLLKLFYYGFIGYSLEMFCYFRSIRAKLVEINQQRSSSDVNFGVPQVST